MKRSKANEGMRSRRYQALAALALSILIFAVGETHAAEPFKAWRENGKKEGKVTYVVAARLSEAKDKENAVKWLVSDPTQANVEKFVKDFAKEPLKFAEGVRLAALELGKDSKFDEKKKDLLEKLLKVSEREFGINKRVPLHLLAEAILAMDPKDLEKKDLEELLKELFNDDMLNALKMVDEDPTKVSTTPTPTVTATATPSVSKTPEVVSDDFGRSRAEVERANQEIERLRREADRRTPVGPQPTQAPVVGGPSVPVAPVGGEVNDAAIQKAAQETCDRIDALKRANENQLLSVVNPLKDALNEQFNQLAALRNLNQGQNNNNKKNEDALGQLLQQALNGDNKKRNETPQLPPQPQQLAQRPQDSNDKSKSVFDQPVPQQQPEQQQAQAPLYIPPAPSADPQIGNIRLALPTATGRTELLSAMNRVSMNEARQPIATTLGPNAQVPDLMTAKRLVGADIRATQTELAQAKFRAGELESALEVAQQGARALLPEKYKRMEKDAKAELEAKKKQYEGLRAQLQQGGNAEQAQQMQPILQQYQAEVSAAEAKAKKVSDEIEIALESGDAEIKRLAKNRDQLNATVTKLNEQLGSLKEEETGVAQLITNAQQLQVQALQNQNQPPQLRSIYGGGSPVRSSATGGAPQRYMSTRSTNSVPASNGNVRRGMISNPTVQ